MPAYFNSRSRISLLVMAFLFSGCTQYAAVPVLVRDKETKAPITGAMVNAGWLSVLDFFPPALDDAITDQNGVVVVQAAYHGMPVVDVSASGYVPARQIVHGDYFRDPKSERRKTAMVFDMEKR